MRLPTLRAIVLAQAGQDLRRCQHCDYCDVRLDPDQDITLQTLVQMVMMNDDEVLTSRTLWSDQVLRAADHLCANRLDMAAVLLALRQEARRRGLAAAQPD